MNPQVFRIIHIVSVLLLFYAFGALSGIGKPSENPKASSGRGFKALHGIALFLILLTGLAQMMALKTGFAPWIHVKLGVWLLLGAALPLVTRKPQWRSWIWLVLLALAAVAVTAAVMH